jgi:hypothetical protein
VGLKEGPHSEIEDQHVYHGAALTQIAEDDEFTAINPLDLLGKRLNSAFRINDNIGIYLKYNSVRRNPTASSHSLFPKIA